MRRGKQQEFFLPEETILIKYPNPYDKLRGLSKLSALEITNKADWGAIKSNQMIFENDIGAGVVFSAPEGVELEDADYKRIEQELIKKREGAKYHHKAMILSGGMKADDLRKTNRDMQYIELRKFNREDVSMVMKVPKPELELYEDINYATALSSDRSFWKKTLIPLMRKIEDALNTQFFYRRGYECYFDVAQIDVLNSEVLEKADTAQKYIAIGYTLNQVNERLGLGFPEVPWGDDPFAGTALLPEPQVRDVTPKAPESIMSEVHRKQWLDIVQKILPEVGRASKSVKAYFKKIERKILREMIKRVDGRVVEIKAPTDDYEWIEDLFEESELKRIIEAHHRAAAKTGIVSIDTPAKVDPDPIVRAVLAAHGGDKIADINRRASRYVIEKLRSILDQAIADGVPEEEVAQRIATGLKSSMANISRRARTIARTEIHGAYSQGRHETMMQTAPVRLRWLSTHDDAVRESHEMMDGEVTDPGEMFSNGLRFPLDPNATDPGEVINCRCAVIAEYE